MSTFAEPVRGSDPANPDPYRRGDQREGFPPPDLTSFTPSDLALYQSLQQVQAQISNLADVLQQANQKVTARQLTQVEIPAIAQGVEFPVVGGVAGAKIAVTSYVVTAQPSAMQWIWKSAKFKSGQVAAGRTLGTLQFTSTAEAGIVPVVGSPESPVLITNISDDLILFASAGGINGGHLVYFTIESGP